ncbi:MAG: vanadium-dependent haloperoxidase [bacterium]
MHPYVTRVLLLSVVLSGCAGDSSITGVVDQCRLAPANALSPDSATAAGRWNALTRGVIARREFGPLGTARTFALVSVAQYNAIVGADDATKSGAPQSEAGAAAGAAAAVLAAVYPAEQSVIDAQLASDAALVAAVASGCAAQFSLGVTAGRLVGAAVLARAATDRSAAPWTGTVPTGAGIWKGAPAPAQPLSPAWGQVRPWLMTSGSQFRPVAPPAFGSAAYQAALDEVRKYSDTRTPEQLRIAQYWGAVVNTSGPHGLWSVTGLDLASKSQLDERATARMLAMMHMAGMDASIGCWDAKFTYWYLRPFEGDAAITTPVGRPNFPSYPSAHSCLSAAYATVLAGVFPTASGTLTALLDEAGISRIYAGLHYRFDIDAGQQIGKSIAALALARVPDGVAIPLN